MRKITSLTVLGIVNSNPRCFRDLYDAYYSYLCGVAVSYIHDFEKAREIVDDVFVRIWERRSQLKYPPFPYLLAAVRNTCYNYLRDVKKVSEVTLVLMERVPEIGLYDDEDVEALVNIINEVAKSLPKGCKEVFHFHYNEGLSTQEISSHLGIAQSTVRVHLKTALDRIREKIKK